MSISLRLTFSCLAIVRIRTEAVGLALAAKKGRRTCSVRCEQRESKPITSVKLAMFVKAIYHCFKFSYCWFQEVSQSWPLCWNWVLLYCICPNLRLFCYIRGWFCQICYKDVELTLRKRLRSGKSKTCATWERMSSASSLWCAASSCRASLLWSGVQRRAVTCRECKDSTKNCNKRRILHIIK